MYVPSGKKLQNIAIICKISLLWLGTWHLAAINHDYGIYSCDARILINYDFEEGILEGLSWGWEAFKGRRRIVEFW